MGIDFGIVNTMLIAFNNIDKFYKVNAAPTTKLNRVLIKDKEDPYIIIDKFTYKYALAVVNLSIKHNSRIIQMENLAGAEFTKNQFFFDLQRQIQYLGNIAGILTRYVNRDYSSQKCSKCSFIHKDNRIDQTTFICLKCGLKINADHNAAINIAKAL
ncbi:transposase [Ruminiclostridium cellobioparum]|uniref:transposase n=1 Tax=Ruminiclostridium cellobioparum TaxID=29355 RepID=UPI0028A65B37|nr:transposase [Ruminiclostridium cellobioparum]